MQELVNLLKKQIPFNTRQYFAKEILVMQDWELDKSLKAGFNPAFKLLSHNIK